ncbi:MAG: alpha-mannosidase, partial [Cellulosilyticaceae bacterium]
MRDMFLTDNKLEARIHELGHYRYRETINFESLKCKDDLEGEVNPSLPNMDQEEAILNVGDSWKGRDKYLWLYKKIQIPSTWADKRVLGLFDYGNTGGGNNSGFESLLYVDGKPFQGVDSNHKEVFLQEEHIGQEVEFLFRLWSGLEGGGVPTPQEHRIKCAQLAWLDEYVDDLYYNGKMIIETLKILDDFDPTKAKIRKMLNDSLKQIDWSYPGSEEFYNSVQEADELLNEAINRFDKKALVNVKCVGHTHIDVAWLWRLKHTREKCARSFSTVVRLMEQYPEYVFLQTQPQLYEYIKNDYPEIYEQIKKKVKAGQWEVDGGMWVEADCNLTSGESLTRQILVGSKFIKDEFDRDVEYLWLPDVFGYSWALPQILKKSGINTFMTTKISWNQYNRMPHDTFKWKGIDGSEVLTHFITTPEPWSQPGSWFYTYNGQLIPKTVQGVWEAYSEKELTNELLVSYGYGDGGGGVNRDMLECRRRIDKIPGLPSLKTGKAGDYFRDLQEKVAQTDSYVHTWDGELYLEYHRGTYTSQAYNKKTNRALEFLYRQAEWIAAMGGIQKGELSQVNQEKFTEGWKIILCNQFHDIIPGSSINEVYKDCHVDYAKAEQIATTLQQEGFDVFREDKANTWTVLNNSNWIRTELVTIPVEQDGVWKTVSGELLKTQKEDGVWIIEVPNVPAMGWKAIQFEETNPEILDSPFRVANSQIETPFYKIKLNEKGQITSLFDKENEIEVIAEGSRANVLQMFEDKPLAHEAWDIDLFYQEKMREVEQLQSLEIVEVGELRAVICLKWQYMSTTISQEMIVYAKDRRIDFKTSVDWRERKQLLKVAFPVNIRATYATYDIQYGNVRRATNWNTSWEQARFETVGHKWVDLSERHYGVSLMNDCKYGHDIKDNVIRLTLLKAATHPDVEQDQGEHLFTYSLLPHEGDWVEAHTEQAAWALNQPLQVIEGNLG